MIHSVKFRISDGELIYSNMKVFKTKFRKYKIIKKKRAQKSVTCTENHHEILSLEHIKYLKYKLKDSF